jgi:hypothetical protein
LRRQVELIPNIQSLISNSQSPKQEVLRFEQALSKTGLSAGND